MKNERFLVACNNDRPDRVPVWFMRQAGRSLPEYRAIRAKHPILDICRTPELAVEVTLQPVRRLGVDAAILFSDIVVPLQDMGVDLDIVEGIGPSIARPIKTDSDVSKIHPLGDEGVEPVNESVRILASEAEVPLIGFGGAPFTLACYMIEGGSSRNHISTKAMMHESPRTWNLLMQVLTDSVVTYLRRQVESGADAVQLFDSWIGELDRDDFCANVLPFVRQIFEGLADLNVPRIYFGLSTGELLADIAASGCDVIGVDWRTGLDDARTRAGDLPLQGNLDPAVLLAGWDAVQRKALDVLQRGSKGAHIFNLGHGVLPETDPDVLKRLVDLVHEWDADG